MSAHIEAKKGEIAKIVLMPGDPKRAEFICKTFLHDYKLVSSVRNIYCFTGYTKNNKRISVMASGMGQPSIGIYSHELYCDYDVESIIRIGTCGCYQPYINVLDIIVALGSSTDSNWMSQYKLNGTFSALADFDLLMSAHNVFTKSKAKAFFGNVLSADIFYDSDPDIWKKWANLNVLGVEMESYALYATAQALKKRALTILTVTDNFMKPKDALSKEQREKGLIDMIEGAITIAEEFA